VEYLRFIATSCSIYKTVDLWLELAHEGFLEKLKKCPVCKKWFFAKFLHNEFDTKKCRELAKTQNPKWRAARRRYERDYYDKTRRKA
jgi:hypothetical protein